MTAIRPATAADIGPLVEMGERFYHRSPFAAAVAYSPEDVANIIAEVMDAGVVLVAESAGELVGGIMGICRPPWFSADPCAIEMAWWVDDAARGTVGLRLHRAFEAWARDQGAAAVVLSDLVLADTAPAGPLYDRLGYACAERSHIRRLVA